MSTEAQTQADLMKRLSRRVIDDGLNAGNVDAFDEAYHTDCVFYGPGGREFHNLAELKEMVSGYVTAFPDMRMTIEQQVAEGNLLATHWRVIGTHDGPLGDIPPTGKRVDIRGHSLSTFERGKISAVSEVWDEHAMIRQLGLAD